MKKRMPALLLAAALLAAVFAACGSEEETSGEKTTVDRSDTAYLTEYLDFDANVDKVVGSSISGTSVYLLGDRYADGGDSFCLLRLSMDSGELEELPDYTPVTVPEGTEGFVYAKGIYAAPDGTLWVREAGAYYTFDLPEDFDPETQNRMDYQTGSWDLDILRQLDQAGAELRQIDVTALMAQLGIETQPLLEKLLDTAPTLYLSLGLGSYLFDFALDEAENLYLLMPGTLYVLDSSQTLLSTLEWEGVYGSLLALAGGGFAVQSYQEETSSGSLTGCGVRAVDLEARDWGETYPLSDEITAAWSGSGDWRFFYTSDDSLYAWDAAADVETRLTVWDRGRIDPALLTQCTVLPDGRIAALVDRYGTMEAFLLTETDPALIPETETLTYAVLSSDYVDWDAVNEFNRIHTDVQIEVKDYSVYDNQDTVGAHSGRDQLLLELAAGQIPDIINLQNGLNSLPYRQLAQKGYLEDLWPYIENDPELGRESLMEAPLKAAEVDGGLYMAFNGVSIQTLVGAESVVEDRYTWSFQDLQAAFAAMPEGSTVSEYCYTKQDMLMYVFALSMDSYVDWESGQCFFDSEAFRAALAFIDSYPLRFDWPSGEDAAAEVNDEVVRRLLEGKQLVCNAYLYGLNDVQMFDSIFGGRASFVGYPREDGSVGSCFHVTLQQLAMFSTCQNKEAAWEFIRQIYLPHTLEELGIYEFTSDQIDEDVPPPKVEAFPINRADFERKKENAMSFGDDETSYQGYAGYGSLEIELHPLTEEEYERFMNFYCSVDQMNSFDPTIFDLVQELCTPFFAGDRTLDETVRLIQNQVGLYVSEQS